jgi:hypothetical protein
MSERLPIYGFSLNRPWPWAMLNETAQHPALRLVYSNYALPAQRVDTFVALHANMQWDATSAGYLQSALQIPIPPATDEQQRFNVIFAVAQWVYCITELHELPLRQRPWFQPGNYHWLLGRFTRIEPVECRPSSPFFTLAEETLKAVRRNYGLAYNPTERNR